MIRNHTISDRATVGTGPWAGRLVLLMLLLSASAATATLFDASVPYGVDGPSVRVVATEVDGVHGPDLVAGSDAGQDGPSVSTLLNDGSGRFATGPQILVDPDRFLLHDIAAADFNGDQRADVAVAADDLSHFPTQTVVLVYLNTGAGGFTAPVEYPLDGLFPACIEAADVTNDQILDLVVCHSDQDTGAGRVTVLPGLRSGGKPTGQFGAPSNLPVGTSPANLAVADVDGDALADLLVSDSAQDRAFVLYGTGGGQFGPPVALANVPAPSAIRTRPGAQAKLADVLIASVLDYSVAVLAQGAPRQFGAAGHLATGQPASDMAALDLNDDGVIDLALPAPTGGTLGVWLGTAGGGLAPGATVAVDEGTNSVSAADFDRDGRPDLATASAVTDRVVVALNAGTTPALAGDANCDGRVDRADLAALVGRLFADGCSGADANGDGQVTAADLTRTIRLLPKTS